MDEKENKHTLMTPAGKSKLTGIDIIQKTKKDIMEFGSKSMENL